MKTLAEQQTVKVRLIPANEVLANKQRRELRRLTVSKPYKSYGYEYDKAQTV